MGDVRLTFDDGSVVRLHLATEGGKTGGSTAPGPSAPAPAAPGTGAGPSDELDLPAGFGSARPVSADGRAAQALTRGGEALTQALRPLGGVLGGIHRSFSQFAQRPDEVTVEFGVTLGSDLSLGVFSGSGEASFTISATWNLADGARPAGAADSADPVNGADPVAPLPSPDRVDPVPVPDTVGPLPVPGPANGS